MGIVSINMIHNDLVGRQLGLRVANASASSKAETRGRKFLYGGQGYFE